VSINEKIGRNIRLGLAARGKRPSDLARELGITKEALNYRLTTGRWRIDDLEAVAEKLNCTVIDLIATDPDELFPRRDLGGSDSACTLMCADEDLVDLTDGQVSSGSSRF